MNEPTRDGESNSLEDKIYSMEVELVNEKQKASHAIKKHSKVTCKSTTRIILITLKMQNSK